MIFSNFSAYRSATPHAAPTLPSQPTHAHQTAASETPADISYPLISTESSEEIICAPPSVAGVDEPPPSVAIIDNPPPSGLATNDFIFLYGQWTDK